MTPVIVVMGVSGCGKTTVGRELAEALGIPFHDADDFHPPANVAKMRAGVLLNDSDREPWLRALAARITDDARRSGAVLSCSALREKYRTVLRDAAPGNVRFVHLKGDRETILRRMQERRDHYMPPSLLDSQFATLEEPQDALTVPIDRTPQEICRMILDHLGERPAAGGRDT